jgi:hypothetical protein
MDAQRLIAFAHLNQSIVNGHNNGGLNLCSSRLSGCASVTLCFGDVAHGLSAHHDGDML